MRKQFKTKLHSPIAHFVLYILILKVVLPLLDIYRTKSISIVFEELSVYAPATICLISIILLLWAVFFRKIVINKITLYKIIFTVIGLLLLILLDYVLNFYGKPNTRYVFCCCHFFAYALYSVLLYRVLWIYKISTIRIVLLIYISALILATIGEFLQTLPKISPGIFDINDIAKDGWGALVILFVTFYFTREGLFCPIKKQTRFQRNIKEYLKSPITLIILLSIFNLLLLIFSYLLTSPIYYYKLILFTCIIFTAVFLILHIIQYRTARRIFYVLSIIVILVQGFLFIKYRKENILFNFYGLTIYKGIPILFFDALIYPNGFFSLVDKKHIFNETDKERLLNLKSDLIIIGSGSNGMGGKGLCSNDKSKHGKGECILNMNNEISTKIVILKTPEACNFFNRMKNQNDKKILFVIHNTC